MRSPNSSSTIYEVDFRGFSYGFRPRRNPHMALDALHTALMSQRVNWVLDADIRSFFNSVRQSVADADARA